MFPGFMTQYPWSTTTIPTSVLLPSQWPQPHSDELLLAMEESDFEEKAYGLTYVDRTLIVKIGFSSENTVELL
ncbi:hypothetical protein FEM48_Zijuj05G0068600 [Ziziphus jujuba var. spinosa]|uniref:Uncharacterized protein n=1 Tax=Ziziphus jujuba var. spinosa TaxID=714518 RepID=A0A978VDG4_ZIZJJ|nr:hypothetical protein FEM48_Zijuj05G0068600 [Ziziphus jujuba var. spinosa]